MIHVSAGELHGEASAINAALDGKIPQIMGCVNAVEDFYRADSLSGAAYTQSKNYYRTVHGAMYQELQKQIGELQEANRQMLSDLANRAPKLGEAFQSVLLEEIDTYQSLRNYYSSLYDYYSQLPYDPRFGYPYSGMLSWCSAMIDMASREIAVRQEVLGQMEAFNSFGGEAYRDILPRMDKLASLLDGLRKGEISTPDAAVQYIMDIEVTRLTDESGNVKLDSVRDLLNKNLKDVQQVEYMALCEVLSKHGASLLFGSDDGTWQGYQNDIEKRYAYNKAIEEQYLDGLKDADGHLNGQGRGALGQMAFGPRFKDGDYVLSEKLIKRIAADWDADAFGTVSHAGCESIAVYNVLVDLGKEPSLAQIIRDTEEKGYTMLNGWGGTKIYETRSLLGGYGVECVSILPENAEKMCESGEAQAGQVYIASVLNDKESGLGGGVHTIEIVYSPEDSSERPWKVYNRSNGSDGAEPYSNLNEILKDKGQEGLYLELYHVEMEA